MGNIFNTLPSYNTNHKPYSSIPIIDLSAQDTLDALMSNDFYCTTELPEYFDFSDVLKYAADSVGDKSLDKCINGDFQPESVHGVNLDVITNKDGRYAVRPLTLANPGVFPPQIPKENIKDSHESYPYNHNMAQVLYRSTTAQLPSKYRSSSKTHSFDE